MRRLIGLFIASMLIAAPSIAQASEPFSPLPDLRTTLLLRLFDEVSGARAPFTVASTTSNAGWPLRTAFVVVIPTAAVPSATSAGGIVVNPGVLIHFTPVRSSELPDYAAMPSVRLRASRETSPQPALALTTAYADDSSQLFQVQSDSANVFSFGSSRSGTLPGFAAQSALGDDATLSFGSQLSQSLNVPLALHLGRLQLLAGFNAGQASVPSTGFENTLPVFVPSYAGVDRSDLGAAFAVPVTPRLLLGVGYNTEHLLTGYGAAEGLDELDARNDTYSGNLTFLFPRLSSAVSLSAQQYRYQDSLLPAEFTQLREDLNLTVKF